MAHMPTLANPSPNGTETVSASGAASTTKAITFVSGTSTALTLADGDSTIDGFIKTFSIRSGSGTMTATHMADGSTHVVSWSAACSFQTIWDNTSTTWRIVGTPRNATVN